MLRALRTAALAAGLGVASIVGVAGTAHAAGTVVHPGQSIQQAIDAASPGDTIILQRGTYNENLQITKDGITIVGGGATLMPPASPTTTGCATAFGDGGPGPADGICIIGDVNAQAMQVNTPVRNVRIIGLNVSGFPGSGIIMLGGENGHFINNMLTDNGAYGAAAFMSTGTSMINNRVSGSDEAGLYIGDSPNAKATLASNDTGNNQFGIFVRDAQQVSLFGNRAHDNCLGILFLADAPGPDGNATVSGNQVKNNDRVCPPSEEDPDTISGLGVAMLGAHDVAVRGNIISGNTPGAGGEASPFHGGVVIVSGDAGTAPLNNTVQGNVIRNNTPDVFWDGTGTGNNIVANVCSTSTPAGLC